MQNLVTALNSAPSKDSSVMTAARKRYVAKANLIALFDLPRLIANGARLAIRENFIPDNSDALDGLKLAPSFVGVTIACEPTGAVSESEIPVAQAQGIAKIVMLFMHTPVAAEAERN